MRGLGYFLKEHPPPDLNVVSHCSKVACQASNVACQFSDALLVSCYTWLASLCIRIVSSCSCEALWNEAQSWTCRHGPTAFCAVRLDYNQSSTFDLRISKYKAPWGIESDRTLAEISKSDRFWNYPARGPLPGTSGVTTVVESVTKLRFDFECVDELGSESTSLSDFVILEVVESPNARSWDRSSPGSKIVSENDSGEGKIMLVENSGMKTKIDDLVANNVRFSYGFLRVKVKKWSGRLRWQERYVWQK